MIHLLMSLLAVLVFFVSPDAKALDYIGICEASAGAFLDATHFAVASDETNTLRIYERGKPAPIGEADMTAFTGFDKSDLEAAAVIGDRVYWMSSHSLNSKGKDNAKRKVFFATKIGQAGGKPILSGLGRPVTSLRDAIASAAGVTAAELNIEGLAATPEGALLIGLRAPLRNGRAIVMTFKNPAAVVDGNAAPEFGKVETIDLGGRGIRSIELLSKEPPQYLISAGPVVDSSAPFLLVRWPGARGDKVDEIAGANLAGMKPEGAMLVPGQNLVQLLSDDGDICSDEDDPVDQRRFRSIDVKP